MRGTRRLALSLAAMAAAVLLASGIAIAATLEGTNGDDTLNGTADIDTINGKDGNDTINGKDSADKLYGGSGVDTISGDRGGDTIEGGNGPDKLYGADAAQTIADNGKHLIKGESGDDTVVGGGGADELYGGGDKDTISGMDGGDTIYGGGGADTIWAGPLEESDTDTVYGEDGDDTIYTANVPASRDVVSCGGGTDKVRVDSLDEVGNSCEKVDRIQEAEPTLPDGTYKLEPDPSSECNLGEGTFTIGVDPESGERGYGVEVGVPEKPQGVVETCEVKVNFDNPVSAQGQALSSSEVSTMASDAVTVRYEGKKPPQQFLDDEEAAVAVPDITNQDQASPTPEDSITAQYAWSVGRYRSTITTIDPILIPVNRTSQLLYWWHDGYDVDYYKATGSCPAYTAYDPVLGYKLSTWYRKKCYWPYSMWYGYDSNRSWIGNQLNAEFYNYDFGDPNRSTLVYTYNRAWGYNYGLGEQRKTYSWYAYGERAFLLRGAFSGYTLGY